MTDLLRERIKRSPPQSQEDCVRLGARHALAQFGPVPENYIRAASRGIAQGIFGEAFENASMDQALKWINMAERIYREEMAKGE